MIIVFLTIIKWTQSQGSIDVENTVLYNALLARTSVMTFSSTGKAKRANW